MKTGALTLFLVLGLSTYTSADDATPVIVGLSPNMIPSFWGARVVITTAHTDMAGFGSVSFSQCTSTDYSIVGLGTIDRDHGYFDIRTPPGLGPKDCGRMFLGGGPTFHPLSLEPSLSILPVP